MQENKAPLLNGSWPLKYKVPPVEKTVSLNIEGPSVYRTVSLKREVLPVNEDWVIKF